MDNLLPPNLSMCLNFIYFNFITNLTIMAKKEKKTESSKQESTTPKLNLNIPKLKDLLEKAAKKDRVLAKAMEREDKNFEGCCNYIVQQVLDAVADRVEKKQGFQFVADYQDPDTVIGWAIHYYTEEDVELEDILKKARSMTTPEVKAKESAKKDEKKPAKKSAKKSAPKTDDDEFDIFSISDIDDISDDAIMSVELF